MRSGDRRDQERRTALVLAIDDEAEVLALLELTLQGLPIRLRCVGTAEEALEAIELEPPAAIVSDHRLPGMLGLELLHQVRALLPGIASLLFTADAEVRDRAHQLPFPVLEKGSSPEAVRAAVSGLLADSVPPE
jgi:CheY-like chemotaxis protein